MKIALVSPYDFAYPGGVTAHISHLAYQFQREGHTVRVLAPSSQPPDSIGVDYLYPLGRPVPVPSGGSIARISLSVWLGRRIRQLLEQERFDIVHLHEPLAPFLPMCVLYLSRSVNVGTFHAYHGSNRLYWLTRRPLTPLFHRLQGRIAVSKPAMEFVSRYFPGDYRIIPNGIDVDHFARPVAPIPDFWDGRRNLLFVGRLEKRKGLKYLLGAFSRLKWDYPDLRLIVVGPGQPDGESCRLMGERNVRDVVFVGPVPYRDLPRYYHSAHIFCSPATGKESFGIVLLEAMATGRPLVATDIPGYASVVRHGVEGLLVPPGDEEALAGAIRTLLDNPQLQAVMGARGRMRAQEFRWERVAQRVLDYYRELLATRATTRVTTAAG